MSIDNNPTICNKQDFTFTGLPNLNICPSVTYGFYTGEIDKNNEIAKRNKGIISLKTTKSVIGLAKTGLDLYILAQQTTNDKILANFRGVNVGNLNQDKIDSTAMQSIIAGKLNIAGKCGIGNTDVTKTCIQDIIGPFLNAFHTTDQKFTSISNWAKTTNNEPVDGGAKLPTADESIFRPNAYSSYGNVQVTSTIGTVLGLMLDIADVVLDVQSAAYDIQLAEYYKDNKKNCQYMSHDVQLGLYGCKQAVPSKDKGALACYSLVRTTATKAAIGLNDEHNPSLLGIYGDIIRVSKSSTGPGYKNFARLSSLIGQSLGFLASVDKSVYSDEVMKKKLCSQLGDCCTTLIDSHWDRKQWITLRSNNAPTGSMTLVNVEFTSSLPSGSPVVSEEGRTKTLTLPDCSALENNMCTIWFTVAQNTEGMVNSCTQNAYKQPNWMGETLEVLSTISKSDICRQTTANAQLNVYCDDLSIESANIQDITFELLSALSTFDTQLVLPGGYENPIETMCSPNSLI